MNIAIGDFFFFFFSFSFSFFFFFFLFLFLFLFFFFFFFFLFFSSFAYFVLLSSDGVFLTTKIGGSIIKNSLQLGYEMGTTGTNSIRRSSYYALNSLIQTILRGLSQQQKQKEENEPSKRPEYEQTFEEVEGQEFVNITRKPTIDMDDFLDDCVEM